MFCNSKEYINVVEQVVKSLEDGLCLYPCSYFSGIEVSRGPFCLRELIKPPKNVQKPKICSSNSPFQYSSPVVHSTVYTLPKFEDISKGILQTLT